MQFLKIISERYKFDNSKVWDRYNRFNIMINIFDLRPQDYQISGYRDIGYIIQNIEICFPYCGNLKIKSWS